MCKTGTCTFTYYVCVHLKPADYYQEEGPAALILSTAADKAQEVTSTADGDLHRLHSATYLFLHQGLV